MEPIVNSAAPLRLATGGAADLGTLLRDGRVLHAEVLAPSRDGTLLLAIGRHSVPAQTDLRLDPGARFLVQVQQTADGPVLQLLQASEGDEQALLQALRSAVGDGRPLGEVLATLGARLRAGAGGRAPELEALALGLATLSGSASGGGDVLRALLGFLGLDHEARLAALAGARPGRTGERPPSNDLKALLLRALLALGGEDERGGTREAVGRALSALEAEQLLNVARDRAGEPPVLAFPFPDGEGWSTARLSVPPRREGEPGDPDEVHRLSLGLELTRLGPLRADLSWSRARLTVRLLVTREETARRLEGHVEELCAGLGAARGAVDVHVRVADAQQVLEGLAPLDIRYLREHNLMNVAA